MTELEQAIKERDELKAKLAIAEEALEASECECEISLPVNDYLRDQICFRCEALAKLRGEG